MTAAHLVLVIVALQRVIELVFAERNSRRLKRQGGIEVGREHYPYMVLLHLSWLAAMFAGVQRDPVVRLVPLILFVLLQAARLWVIATLGRFWTTRVITVPGEPLVQTGPYRYVRHPNYLVVIGEMAVLPLVFEQIRTAVIFSLLNAVLLMRRIQVENAVLEARRPLAGKRLA